MKNIEISWKHGLNIETRWLYNLSYLFYTRFSGYILKIYEHAELSKKLWENLENNLRGPSCPKQKQKLKQIKQKWIEKGCLENLPCVYSSNLLDEEISLMSLLERASFLHTISQLNPPNIKNRLYPIIRRFYDYVLNLSVCILENSLKKTKEGLIIFLDVYRTTPATIHAEKYQHLPEHNVIMQQIFREIANIIKLYENNTKYWLLGGDSFISFSVPTCTREEIVARKIYQIILAVKRKLKEIKREKKIPFRGGAHFGKLLLAGEKIYLNLDYIKAVRAQEYCKEDGEILVTDIIKKKIENIGIEVKFSIPKVWIEKHVSIQPQKVSMHFDVEEVSLYVIKEDD